VETTRSAGTSLEPLLRVLDTANVLTTQNSPDFEQLGSPNLIHDYTKSVSKIYHEFAVCTISVMQSLDVLSASRCHTKIAEFLPSWVPDWSETGSVALVRQLSSRFQATKKSKHNARFLTRQTIFVVEGEILDEIAKVRDQCWNTHTRRSTSHLPKALWYIYDSIMTMAYYQKVLAGWERFAHESQSRIYITGEDSSTVHAQTQTASHKLGQDIIAAHGRWQQDNGAMRLLTQLNLDSWAALVQLTAVLHLSSALFHNANLGIGYVLRIAQLSPPSSLPLLRQSKRDASGHHKMDKQKTWPLGATLTR
jgi:hypothetical protein